MWRLVLSISPEVPIFRTAVSAPLHSRTVSSVITKKTKFDKSLVTKNSTPYILLNKSKNKKIIINVFKYSKWLQFLANWKWTLKQLCYSIDPLSNSSWSELWPITSKHTKTPTLLCLYDDTHTFPGGVKLQNMKQLIPPHLSVECHLQMVVSHSMENNTIPEAMHKSLLFLISSITTIHQIIIELNSRV